MFGINTTLDVLQGLKSTVREFAQKDEALRQDRTARLAALSKSFESAARKRSVDLEQRLQAVQAESEAARQSAQATFEKREARIGQAHKSALKRTLDGIEEKEGRVKYTLQRRTLESERQREADLSSAGKRLEEFRKQVVESQDQFAKLEVAAYHAFSSFAKFRGLLTEPEEAPEADPPQDEDQLLRDLGTLRAKTEHRLRRFKWNPLIALFRIAPLWLVITFLLVLYGAYVLVLPRYQFQPVSAREALIWLGGAVVLATGLYWLAKGLGRPAATAIARDLIHARQWHAACLRKAESRKIQDEERIRKDWERAGQQFSEEWERAAQEAGHERAIRSRELEERAQRASRRNAEGYRRALETLDGRQAEMVARAREQSEAAAAQSAADREAARTRLEHEFETQSRQLLEEWRVRIEPIWERVQSANGFAERLCPAWDDPSWNAWAPPTEFAQAVKFGALDVDLERLAELKFADSRLALPGPSRFSVPLLLTFPEQGSLLFETGDTGRPEAIGAINAILFRLLALGPPGRLSFTIFDPVGLGQNFAGLMHLADYEESQVNNRIWTQTAQMEERLGELNEHMEKVIQMYLRNEYATIAEYNAHAGVIAEKYHFLVIAGFPSNFSETAGRRLLNIAASGARCGVYTLIQWDTRHELPHDFIADELRKHSIRIIATDRGLVLAGQEPAGVHLKLDPAPPPQFATEFLHKVGRTTRDSNRVELPFSQIAPDPSQRWSETSAGELRIPIGRSGAAKLQYLAIGKGTRQHVLIAGKTGSGKSTLFHVMITNIGLWCSPDEVEFYLVDFKKGVEFKCYADRRLPHARVVAIESDREFGLSVLQRVDDELRRRGDLFRKAGVQDLPGFREAMPGTPMPRLLLMIDEFQEFFTEEDRISQSASVLLDRIVRQGRAFGIHVLLGSQTLGGAYTLARATMGQMVIRIALQCNEADAYLIMDESNAAPRLLSRPGEGIYNDMAGALEGNSPFQVAWLSDTLRDEYLNEIRARADATPGASAGPIVFEGNAPAHVRENPLLQGAIQQRPNQAPPVARVWLGAPNSIKGPTEVVFQRQSGSNLLIVGQREEAALGMVSVALISLAAQFPPDSIRLVLLDNTAPGTPEREYLDRIVGALPLAVVRPKRPELAEVLGGLASEIPNRTGDEPASEAPETFLVIVGLQDFKSLRAEDDFSFSSPDAGAPSPSAALSSIVSDGPSRGFHVIATIDNYNNVGRYLGRKGLSEFEARVLFQMSASDSASLIDNPDAGKLGLHRALLYNEREGYLEKFRPYALPENDWLEQVAASLASPLPGALPR